MYWSWNQIKFLFLNLNKKDNILFLNKVMLLTLINQMYFCDKYALGKSVLPGIAWLLMYV